MRRNFGINMIAAVLFFVSAFLTSGQVFGAKALYDDFSDTFLDSQKWRNLEIVRETADGTLHLHARGSGEQVTLGISPVTKTDYIEAKVRIDSESWMDQTGGHARLILVPYNEKGTRNGYLDDIWVTNRMQMDKNGNLTATAGVWRFDDPVDGNIGTTLFWENFSTTIDFDTWYTLSIEFTGTQLIFTCNGEAKTYSITTPIFQPTNHVQYVRSRVHAGGSGYIKAQIDDVSIVKGSVYDQFTTDDLDPSKWETLELLREISGDKLQLNVQAANSRTDATIAPINQTTDYLEAKVLVESGSWVSSGATGRVRIAGYYYNEARGPGSGQNYNEYEDDVWVSNEINLDENDNLVASCSVYRHDDPDSWGPGTSLFYQAFTTPIDFDTEYALSIEFTGSSIIFGCETESYQYDITTAMYPPSSGQHRQLKSRVYADPGESGSMKATFDDVYTDAFNKITGTVVVEGEEAGQFVVPLPGARIFAVDTQETTLAGDVCDSPGAQYSLMIPQDATIELLVQGPAGSTAYVSTYYPFMETAAFEPDDLSDLELMIMKKEDAQGIRDELLDDPSNGVIVAVVEAASDASGLPGVTFSTTDYQSGDPLDAEITYLDENAELDLGLSETSSSGVAIIYNIPLEGAESRDVQVSAEKQGYDFSWWPERCRVYPYQASPEKVTVVPFEGAESETDEGAELETSDGDDDDGVCFISTLR